MPRRSSVDANQVGPRIIQLSFTDNMSIPDIQKKLARESDVHLSEGAIRTYLDKVPKEVVEKAERAGLIQKVEPLLEYRNEMQSMFKDLRDQHERIKTEVGIGTGLESDAAFCMELAEQHEVDIDKVRAIVRATLRERQGPTLVRLFFAGVAEMRKMLDLAAKLDERMGQKRPAAAQAPTYHIKNAVITGQDLTSIVDEAGHKFRRKAT